MWVVPGAHRGPLRRRFVRTGDATHFVELETAPLATEGALPLEVERGTVVLFDGNLPHKSDANRSQRRRPAYTLHVVDGACDYAADNWLPLP